MDPIFAPPAPSLSSSSRPASSVSMMTMTLVPEAGIALLKTVLHIVYVVDDFDPVGNNRVYAVCGSCSYNCHVEAVESVLWSIGLGYFVWQGVIQHVDHFVRCFKSRNQYIGSLIRSSDRIYLCVKAIEVTPCIFTRGKVRCGSTSELTVPSLCVNTCVIERWSYDRGPITDTCDMFLDGDSILPFLW